MADNNQILVRIQMVKAMEFISRHINDEGILEDWLTDGVCDGDIEVGDLNIGPKDMETLGYYAGPGTFACLMETFLECMAKAKEDGGLYCGGVVSN